MFSIGATLESGYPLKGEFGFLTDVCVESSTNVCSIAYKSSMLSQYTVFLPGLYHIIDMPKNPKLDLQ